jgi:hypothetical protein
MRSFALRVVSLTHDNEVGNFLGKWGVGLGKRSGPGGLSRIRSSCGTPHASHLVFLLSPCWVTLRVTQQGRFAKTQYLKVHQVKLGAEKTQLTTPNEVAL